MIKNILFTAIAFLMGNALISQVPWNNLIPNYSFESVNIDDWLESGLGSTTEGLGDMRYTGCSDCFDGLNNYEKIVQYWSYCDNWTVPERKNFLCGVLGFEDPVGTPDITYEVLTTDDGVNSEYQRHYSGQFCAYTGAGAGEFVVIQPEETLEKDKFYYIEAFVGLDDNTSGQTGSIELFTEKPEVCKYEKYITEYSVNSPFQTVLFCEYPYLGEDSLGWTRYRAYFRATENFEWLSIGSAGTFYWDDLKIIEVSENLCRDNWYFDNTVFNYPKEVFQASDKIVAGYGVDPEPTHQPGPVTVLQSSHTIFRAGNEIILEDGFEVDSINGAVFEAIIEPCTDICPPLGLGYERFYCISDSTNIGLEGYEGTFATLTWSPTTYLDDPTSANPTFIPPGGNGTILYTVHYERECYESGYGANGVFFVQVNYSDGLDTPAEVSYSGLTYDNYLLENTIVVNDVVDEVEICWTTTDGEVHCQTYFRGTDFDDGSIDFAINHLQASCCANTTFTVTARSYCETEATTSFIWEKEGEFGFIGELPNIITPLTPDGDNDEYCFEVNQACSYTFEVIHPWGTTLFSTSGFVTEAGEICPWAGQKDNGDLLPNGNYWVDIRLYNDCGEEEFQHRYVYIPGPGMMQEESGGGEQSASGQGIHRPGSDATVLQEGNQVYVFDPQPMPNDIMIVDNTGRLVHKGQFTNNFSIWLSSGVYYLMLVSENGMKETTKIIVL